MLIDRFSSQAARLFALDPRLPGGPGEPIPLSGTRRRQPGRRGQEGLREEAARIRRPRGSRTSAEEVSEPPASLLAEPTRRGSLSCRRKPANRRFLNSRCGARSGWAASRQAGHRGGLQHLERSERVAAETEGGRRATSGRAGGEPRRSQRGRAVHPAGALGPSGFRRIRSVAGTAPLSRRPSSRASYGKRAARHSRPPEIEGKPFGKASIAANRLTRSSRTRPSSSAGAAEAGPGDQRAAGRYLQAVRLRGLDRMKGDWASPHMLLQSSRRTVGLPWGSTVAAW